MAGATFGRKGLADGATTAPSRRATFGAAAPAPTDPDDPYAELKASFLASERARGAAQEGGAQAIQAPRTQTTERAPSPPKEPSVPGEKKILVAYALWLCLGAMSGHRLYLGRPFSALGQWALWYVSFFLYFAGHSFAVAPLAAGLLWLLADGFRLPEMLSATNDKLRGRLELKREASPPDA